MTDDVQFQTSSTTVVRGFESRTIAKWEADGWELVEQKQGTLRTELTFRRQKRKASTTQIAIGAAVAVVIAAVLGVGALLDRDDDGTPAAAPTVSATAAAEPELADTEPSAEPTEETAVDEAVDEAPLTIENSEALAALLTGPDQGPSVEQFAAEHRGHLIEFDANIGAMAPHGNYSTRYDILVSYGDYSETVSAGGPAFQFRDVNTTSDLHYVGNDIPGSIGVGDNIRVTARVLEFDSFRLLFQLEPVATEFR